MAKKRGAGEGSIIEEKPGKWRARISLGFRNGKRARKTFTAGTRREVQEKLTKALRETQLGYNVAPERLTLAAWLERWLEAHVKPSVRPKTYTFYECNCRNWITPTLGTVLLSKLTPTKLQEFLNARLAAGLSPKTVRHVHRTIRTALGTAEKFGYVTRNVATLIDSVHVPRPTVQALNPEQARKFLEAAEVEPLYGLYALMLCTGLRLGEAYGLKWDDVDFESGRVTVRTALQWVKVEKGKRRPVLVEPKSTTSKRTLKLPAIALSALARHKGAQDEAMAFAGTAWSGNPLGLVFTNSIGNPLDEKKVHRVFRRILKSAGLPMIRIHDLRHSAASILIAHGLGAKAIAEMLGHSAVSFTLQTYGHLFDEAKQATADAMDAALKPGQPGREPAPVRPN